MTCCLNNQMSTAVDYKQTNALVKFQLRESYWQKFHDVKSEGSTMVCCTISEPEVSKDVLTSNMYMVVCFF